MARNQRSQGVANDTQSILEALPDVVLVLDAMGRIDFASAGSARYLGSRPRDWIGLSALDRIHFDDTKAVVERLEISRRGLATPTQALPIRVAVGNDKWRRVAAHGFVQIDVDGLAGTLVMFRDMVGTQTRESARRAALATVFNREASQLAINHDDRTWITTHLLPQTLDTPDPNGPLVAVIVMTLREPSGASLGRDPQPLDNPVGALAHRVRGALRPNDVLSRLGDSQLVVLCSGLTECHQGLALARRLHRWCSPSSLSESPTDSLLLSTGCAIASQGDDANAVLDYASQSDAQLESGQFLLAAA